MSDNNSDYKTLICIENAEIISYKHYIEYISSALSQNQADDTPDLVTFRQEIISVVDSNVTKPTDDKQLNSQKLKSSPSSRKLLAVGTFQVYEFNGLIYMSCGRGRSISSANLSFNSNNSYNNNISSAASMTSNGNNQSVSSNAFVYPLLPKLRIFRLDQFEFVLALFHPQRFWRIRFDVMSQICNKHNHHERDVDYETASDDFDKEILVKQVDLLQRIFEKYCNFKDLSRAESIENKGSNINTHISSTQRSRTRNRLSKLFKPKSKKLSITSDLSSNNRDNETVLSATPEYINSLIDEKVEKRLQILQKGTHISHKSNLSEDKGSTNTEEVLSTITDSTTAATSLNTNGNIKLKTAKKKDRISNQNEAGNLRHVMNNFDKGKEFININDTSSMSSNESAYDVLQNEPNNKNDNDSGDNSFSKKTFKSTSVMMFDDDANFDENELQLQYELGNDTHFGVELSKKLNNEVVKEIFEMKTKRNTYDDQYVEQTIQQKNSRNTMNSLKKPLNSYKGQNNNQSILYSKNTGWMDFNDKSEDEENNCVDQDTDLDDVLKDFSLKSNKKTNNSLRRIPKIEYEPSHHRKLKMRDEVQSYYSMRSFRSLKGSNNFRKQADSVTAAKNNKIWEQNLNSKKSTDYLRYTSTRSSRFFADSKNEMGRINNDSAMSDIFTSDSKTNKPRYKKLVQNGMMLTNEEIFNLVVHEDEEKAMNNAAGNHVKQEFKDEKSSGFLYRYLGW